MKIRSDDITLEKIKCQEDAIRMLKRNIDELQNRMSDSDKKILIKRRLLAFHKFPNQVILQTLI